MWKTKGQLLLMVMLLPACAETDQRQLPWDWKRYQRRVADNTNALLGKTVTIRSEPVKKIGPNTFTVRDDDFWR